MFLAIRRYFKQSNRASLTKIDNSKIEFLTNALRYNYARGISGLTVAFSTI
jgi:hypothetical protein